MLNIFLTTKGYRMQVCLATAGLIKGVVIRPPVCKDPEAYS